jgi:hypothetical protein
MQILVNPEGHSRRTYELVGDVVTPAAIATALGAAVGRGVDCRVVTYEETRRTFLAMGLEEWAVR